MPSVRELADELGIATVTVSQAYKELREAGLLNGFHGRGTFVAEGGLSAPEGQARTLELHRQIDRLIAIADAHGVARADLAAMVNARLGRDFSGQPIKLAFVGIFFEATRSYAAELRLMLRPGDSIEATTLGLLERDPKARKVLFHADLVVTLAHRKAQVSQVIGSKIPMATVNFIPSERTRTALAELGSRTRLGILSTFPEFLPTMKSGVERFAAHLDTPLTAVLDDPESIQQIKQHCDVIVYATGSESILEGLPERIRAFEYRHVPDLRSVERDLLPVIERLRERKNDLVKD